MKKDTAIRKMMEEMVKKNIISPLDFISVKRYLGMAYTVGFEHATTEPTIIQMDLAGRILDTFSSTRQAEAITGISHQNISKVLNGKRHTSGKCLWAYDR